MFHQPLSKSALKEFGKDKTTAFHLGPGIKTASVEANF